ncbi:hypothetical protein [Microcystis aeruginosa]|uniref:Uncharacterized protein n=1 Tax=Microcystis aeruginosa PCC 9443 TaxID=1160281 RepID=I4G692_MICAE|nr:hypothetical protein [Microcystis aeruginosa]CCI03453.1 hypothetical protein MICAC_4600002 [Microcystis aeruginosa PCC 9443]
MIQNLVLRIISLLVKTLASVVSPAEQLIKAGPVDSNDSSNLPMIVITPGCFTISQQPGENTSNQPRPEEFREKLAVIQGKPLGPYILAKTPLQGTVQCQAFFAEGTLTEKQIWLQEKQDFIINYKTQECNFTYDISKAKSILFIYSFVGIFSLRNFEQELFIEVQAASINELEKLTALIAGSILTHHDQLIEAYNQDTTYKTEYNAASLGILAQLRQIQFLAGNTADTSSIKMKLKFLVTGQLKATRAISENFGIIEKIEIIEPTVSR